MTKSILLLLFFALSTVASNLGATPFGWGIAYETDEEYDTIWVGTFADLYQWHTKLDRKNIASAPQSVQEAYDRFFQMDKHALFTTAEKRYEHSQQAIAPPYTNVSLTDDAAAQAKFDALPADIQDYLNRMVLQREGRPYAYPSLNLTIPDLVVVLVYPDGMDRRLSEFNIPFGHEGNGQFCHYFGDWPVCTTFSRGDRTIYRSPTLEEVVAWTAAKADYEQSPAWRRILHRCWNYLLRFLRFLLVPLATFVCIR